MSTPAYFWLPMLSEQWATTYLQILFGLMLFALGLPTVAYQLMVQEEVRHVSQRRWPANVWFISLALTFVGALGFIWSLHPTPQPAAADSSAVQHTSYAAAIIVTIVPLVSLLAGYLFVKQNLRDNVVRRLTRTLERSARRRGHLDESALYDLIYLGARGESGYQKGLVLKLIDELAAKVQLGDKYTGCELDILVRGLEAILCPPERAGSDENFEAAIKMLQGVWHRLSGPESRRPADSIAALETLKRLALYSVTQRTDQTVILFLEESAVRDSNIVFEIGLAAMQAKKFVIAAYALAKLEGLLAPTTPAAASHARDTEEKVKGNLLGLIAHFTTAGSTASRQAQLTLDNNQECFTPTLQDALTAAFQHNYDLGRYETADQILAMTDPQPA